MRNVWRNVLKHSALCILHFIEPEEKLFDHENVAHEINVFVIHNVAKVKENIMLS